MLTTKQTTALTVALAAGGLLGLFFLAGRAQAKPSTPQNPPLPSPKPPSPGQGGVADATAAAIAAAIAAAQGGGTRPGAFSMTLPPGTLLPNPAPLVQNTRYVARLELTGLDKLGTRDQIRQMLESQGFQNVTVYMTEQEVPAGVFPAAALQNITGGSRWVVGMWGQASQSFQKPAQIQAAWVAP